MWVLCYCLFLFCDIKSSNLSFPQTKPVKLKILDITFSSFDCFNGNKIKINFCGKEFKALHNLRKQKHLVIKKADKDNSVLQILRTLSFTIFMAFIQKYEKFKKRGGSMVRGQVLLKGGDGGGHYFSYLISSRFIIFTFRNCSTLCKIVVCI